MKLRILQLFSSIFFAGIMATNISSAQKIIPVQSDKTLNIRIDPLNALGANASDILDKVNYIPLETSKESTFGVIGQLKITNDYFIILDPITNAILVFTKQGKFHCKISKAGQSPIQGFAVNNWRGQIVFQLGDFKPDKFYYDFNGKLIKSEATRDGDAIFPVFEFVSQNRTISYVEYQSDPRFPPYFISFNQNFKATEAYGIPYDKRMNFRDIYRGLPIQTYEKSGIDSILYFANYYDYSVYQISSNSIERKYKFVFPLAASLPTNFTLDTAFDGKRSAYLEKHKKVIYLLSNCYQIKDNLIFRANMVDRSTTPNLIYNLKSGTLIDYNHVLTDAFSYYLPISGGFNYQNTGIIACDGEFLYTAFSSLDLFKAYETNQPKNVKYNNTLYTYFTKGSKLDNPVLLQFKIKEDQ